MIKIDRIEARIDETIKNKAKVVLANHGMTISDFVRMTLTTVANEGLPQYYPIPNRELKDSVKEVVNDLSGKKYLPEAHDVRELDQLLTSEDELESSK